MEKETEKQLDFIRKIQDRTGIIYTGKSKRDAQMYISNNLDKYNKQHSINDWAIVNGYGN